jgi:flagellin
MIVRVSHLDVSFPYAVQNAFDRLANVSFRLATSQRINRGSDDPAGLIASHQIARELTAVEMAVRSMHRTRAFTQVADSALAEASHLLNNIQSNLVAAANGVSSPEELQALQAENDAALDALNRLGATSFSGKQVFGESAQVLAGTSPTDVATLDLPALDESLGGTAGTLADLRAGGAASIASGDLERANNILNEARSQVVFARAEVGAFEKYVVDSTERVLEDMQVQLTGALSSVRDTDFAVEASNLVRERLLTQATMMMSQLLGHERRYTFGVLENFFNQSN